jgi:hypothetical protein
MDTGNTQETRQREAVQGLLTILARLDVVPVLIGGRALAARGIPVDTTDIDLLLACDEHVVHQLAIYLKKAGYDVDALSENALRRGCLVELRCYRGEIQMDLVRVVGSRLEAVYRRASAENWSGMEIRMARLVDVVIEKLRIGRVRELMDAQTAIRQLLSDGERCEALRVCQSLGLITSYRQFIETAFGHCK